MPSLRILSGSLENQQVELAPDPMTIGRSSSCDIRIADAGVSSRHAKIWCEDGHYFLMDLGSTNGTFVNDRDVDREQLSDGDVITFGMTKAQFVGEKPRPARVNPNRRPDAQQRARGAPEPVTSEAPEGIVTDEPRRPALRADVRTADEIELATLRGKVAFFEDENRKVKAQLKLAQEQAAHEAAAAANAGTEKLRALLKQREDELRDVRKELDEKETYYSPAELERERKRMELALEAERRRDLETLQRQIKELEHRVAVRGAESDTVARQLKEKDDLIQMLSEREDEAHKELRTRDGRIAQLHAEMAALKEQSNAFAGKEKELNDKLKGKNAQLAQLGKERGELVQELAKARSILARIGGADEAAAAVEEQERAAKATQDRIAELEADVARSRDAASVIGGKLDAAEAAQQDLKKQLQDTEAQLTDAVDARMKVEGQLSELLRKGSERDAHEKQLAMMKADRDARAAEAKTAADALADAEAQLAKIRGTFDDIVQERDQLKAKVESLESEARMAATGSQLRGDWEARYRSAQDDIGELKAQLAKLKLELTQARELASKSGAAADEGPLRFAQARGVLHATLVQAMLEGVNNSVSLLRRNAELLKGYVDDCTLLANAVRRIDYTRLEPEQQQMLVELVAETQPDVIVKNMAGIGEENAESIARAKKLIGDYQDAFRRDDALGIEMDAALARAQGLFHATDPGVDVPVKVESVLPPVAAEKEDAVLFAWALLREARHHAAEEDGLAALRVETDGLSITFTVGPLAANVKERYRNPQDAQERLVHGFAIDATRGTVETRDADDGVELVVTLKAKL